MGRLADLASGAGLSLSQAAGAAGVEALLLVRIDQGMQAIPARLAATLAAAVGAAVWEVRAACVLTTDLDLPILYRAIPPLPGEHAAPAVIAATQPVRTLPPAAAPNLLEVDLTGAPGNIQIDLTGAPGTIEVGTP